MKRPKPPGWHKAEAERDRQRIVNPTPSRVLVMLDAAELYAATLKLATPPQQLAGEVVFTPARGTIIPD